MPVDWFALMAMTPVSLKHNRSDSVWNIILGYNGICTLSACPCPVSSIVTIVIERFVKTT